MSKTPGEGRASNFPVALVRTATFTFAIIWKHLQVDEFHKDAAGHGWPKLFSTASLKNFHNGFLCVVSLQVLQPGTLTSPGHTIRRQTAYSSHNYDPTGGGGDKRVPPHPMLSMRVKAEYSDAVLLSSDSRWTPTHRFILASRSELFRNLMVHDQGVPFVYQSPHSLAQLELLLDLLYLGRLPERGRTLSKELVELARFYKVVTVLRDLEYDHRRFRQITLSRVTESAATGENIGCATTVIRAKIVWLERVFFSVLWWAWDCLALHRRSNNCEIITLNVDYPVFESSCDYETRMLTCANENRF